MYKVRKSDERGITKIDWLYGKHSFSFGHYYDEDNMGFGNLRVINEDEVKAGGGFATHPHKDMEIITYILDGALEHKDSLGTGSVIVPGDVQKMTAGTGILHSEFNHSKENPVHLLQIWILPNKNGLSPSYQQKNFNHKRGNGKLILLVSEDGRDESITINQDVNMYLLDLNAKDNFNHEISQNRKIWIQIARGAVNINNIDLFQGDGLTIEQEKLLDFVAERDSEILIFDMK